MLDEINKRGVGRLEPQFSQVVVDYNPPTEHSPTAEFGLMISMSPQSQMSENDMMDLIKKIWGKIVSEKLMLERSLIKNVG